MANTIQKFTHSQFGEIRVYNRQGEPWFIGKEVAEKLGYKKPSNAVLAHVDDEDKTSSLIQGSGTSYQAITTLINESGLYALILASKLPQAQAFKRWVTSEVLPQIRKTGGYIPVSQEDDDKTILAKAVGILQRTVALKNAQLNEQAEIIGQLAPDAAYAEQVLAAPGCYTMTEVAKGLSMTVKELQHRLHELGIIFRAPSGMFMLYAPFQKHGYEAYRTKTHEDLFGNPTPETYLVWTERGRQFLHELIHNS